MFVSAGYDLAEDPEDIDYEAVETRRLLLKHFNTPEVAFKVMAVYGLNVKHAANGETVRVSYEKLGITSEVFCDYERPVDEYLVEAVTNLLLVAILDGHIKLDDLFLFTGVERA